MNGIGFPQMEDVIQPGRCGVAEVRHQVVSEFDCALLAEVKGWATSDPGGVNVALVIHEPWGQEVAMMSDMRFERASCVELLERAHGRVLIAGLGLGMILHPLCVKPGVEHITVVERIQDVIDLVGPTVTQHPNLEIIQGDIFAWKPPAGAVYDTIWFDIWPNWGTRILADIATLHGQFRRYLAAGGWMESWMRRESARGLRHTKHPELRAVRQKLARYFHRIGVPISSKTKFSVGTVEA